MNYNELCTKYNFTLPDDAKDYFDDFLSDYDRNIPVLSEKNANIVADATKLPDEARLELIRSAKTIDLNDDAHFLASFLAYFTVYKREPWENNIYTDDFFTVEGLYPEQIGWVLVATMFANTLNTKNPPVELNQDNLKDFLNFTQSCFDQKGYWGIGIWHWNMIVAGGCLFRFGIFRFAPNLFYDRFYVITDGKQYVTLANSGYFIGKENEFVETEGESVGKTYFYEDNNKYIGNVIAKNGKVQLTASEFDKTIWKEYMRPGSLTLTIHIPPNVDYTPENARLAFIEAAKFYKEFYPDFDFKAIDCHSWIFSNELRKVLPENSKLIAMLDSVHLLPDFGWFTEDLRFIRKGTGMYNRIAEERSKGTVFHFGMMYVPFDEIENFGK